jgi:type IV secretion system protein TrbL
MPSRRYQLALALGLTLLALLCVTSSAVAAPAPAGVQAGHAVPARASDTGHQHGSPFCSDIPVPVIGTVGGELACAALGVEGGAAGGVVGGLVGEAASAAGGSVMNALAEWMIGAATQITVFVSRQMRQTSTPQLQSAWYEAQFQPMADLGAALGLLVAMIALTSAAIRRDPQALAATLVGIVRAGIGTGLVIPLTMIALAIADGVSSAVLTGSPHTFWATVAHAWGAHGFGGFGSSALATLIALVEVVAGVFVWLELIVRGAVIYVDVLFFAAALAAGIWPALASWPGRLARLLLLFVILKPVALIVLSLAGGAAAAGLSFGGGVTGSVGTILAAIVIFALAAFAPWALMYLLAADAESAYMAAGLRAATGAAVGSEHGRSVRNVGGLRDFADAGGASGGESFGAGGTPGPDGGGGGGLTAGPSGNGGGSAAAAGEGASPVDGALPVGAESIGAGSIGAAAGLAAQQDTGTSQATDERPGVGAVSVGSDQTAGVAGETSSPGVLAAVPDGPAGAERAARPADAGGVATGASPPPPGSAGTPSLPAGEQPAGGDPSPDPQPTNTGTLSRSPTRRTRSRPLVLVASSAETPERRPGRDESA